MTGASLKSAAVAIPDPITSTADDGGGDRRPRALPCLPAEHVLRRRRGHRQPVVRSGGPPIGVRAAPASIAAARRLGVDLVAPGDARQPVAGEQQEVERGRGDADERLHAAHAGALDWGEDRHG